MGREAVSLVPRTYSHYQLGLALQVTAEGQEPLALPLQLQQLAPHIRAGAEPEASEGLHFVFSFVVEILACQYPVWRHGAGSMFAFADVQNRLTMLAVVFCSDEEALIFAVQALKVSGKLVSHSESLASGVRARHGV